MAHVPAARVARKVSIWHFLQCVAGSAIYQYSLGRESPKYREYVVANIIQVCSFNTHSNPFLDSLCLQSRGLHSQAPSPLQSTCTGLEYKAKSHEMVAACGETGPSTSMVVKVTIFSEWQWGTSRVQNQVYSLVSGVVNGDSQDRPTVLQCLFFSLCCLWLTDSVSL